jgi:hypothetical protein
MAKPNLEYDTIEHSEAPTGSDEKFYIERYHWRDADAPERGGIKVSVPRVFEREGNTPLRKKILPIENDADAVEALGQALLAQAALMRKNPTPEPSW